MSKRNPNEIKLVVTESNIQDIYDGLTQLQKKFAEEYVVDFNAAAAIVRAGSDTAHPAKLGSQYKNHPGVKLVIEHLISEKASELRIDSDYVMRKLMLTVERAEDERNHTATLRGLEILARIQGMFVDKTEITGRDGEAIKYEKMASDAADFTNAIARLADRGGANRVDEEPDAGDAECS